MAHPTALISVALALLGVCLGASVQIASAAEAPVERHTLCLNVENAGQLVTGLSQENLRLQVNGQRRSFQMEKPEAPSVALLLEYSTASWRGFQTLNPAIRSFLEHAPKDDPYTLAVYSRSLMVAFEFTRQTSLLSEAYRALGNPIWSEINTYDAVYGMLDRLGPLPGRHILILVGSGVDTMSGHTLQQVTEEVASQSVTIYAIGVAQLFAAAYGASQRTTAQSFLEMLGRASGGGAWFPNQAADVPAVLDGIVSRINTQYCLVYESPKLAAGKFDTVKVEAFGKGEQESPTVRARQRLR